jgi:CDP-paratose 2-epimerase
MKPESILITGGAGFIGSNLACHLRSVYPRAVIVCMDNLYRRGSELNIPRLQELGIDFHRGDIRFNDQFPADKTFDLLIECSAEPSVMAGQDGSPDYLFQTNLVGAYHCLEWARKWHSRVLFLSTSRVYPVARLEAHPWLELETRFAWQDEGTPGLSSRGVTEAFDLNGARSLYGYTKLSVEQLIEEYRASFGLKAIVNRCGVVAGPWQFGKVDQGVIALWVMAHVFGKPLSYIGYGGLGKQVRDVLHVQDLCELLALQIADFDTWDGWIGNVAGGLENSVSLLELTALCLNVTDSQVPILSDPQTRPFDLRLFIADCERLFARSPWRPSRSLLQIVLDTSDWASKNQTLLQTLN